MIFFTVGIFCILIGKRVSAFGPDKLADKRDILQKIYWPSMRKYIVPF